MMRSLRGRLIRGMVGGMAALFILFDVLLFVVIRSALESEFEESLESLSQTLATLVIYDPNQDVLRFNFKERMITKFEGGEMEFYYQFRREDGQVAMQSDSLGEDEVLWNGRFTREPKIQALRRGNGQRLRVAGMKFRPRREGGAENPEAPFVRLLVARDAGEMLTNQLLLGGLLLLGSAGLILLSVAVANAVVGQGLKPVNTLAAEIASIKEAVLAKRIEIKELPTEIEPIRRRLNDMLGRLEESFARERQFTADVAHELRTPITGICSAIEVTLRQERDSKEYQESFAECLDIARSMQKMVEKLLLLGRLDARQVLPQQNRIELKELTDQCWQPFSERAAEKNITFSNRIGADFVFTTDGELLGIMFANLFDNAVEYGNEGGEIWITARRTDKEVEIEIANTGCQITEEQITRVFDRFWRHDPARTEGNVHSGLGLALVKKIINALGGSAAAKIIDDGLFVIQLRFINASSPNI